MDKELKLTVNVVTYNHAKYINECLDSILSQKTNFDFIIRVFDDASTDETQTILKQYKEKYGDKIELYLAEKNLGEYKGTLLNPLRSYENIKTPYFMYIEGDDYLCDNKKFQIQVDALDKHPECIYSSHLSGLYLENEKLLILPPPSFLKICKHKIIDMDKIITSDVYLFSHISTRIIRTSAIKIDPENPDFFLYDVTQVHELIKQGSAYIIDKHMSVYRICDGIYSSKSLEEKIAFNYHKAKKYNEYTNRMFERSLYIIFAWEVIFRVNFDILIKNNKNNKDLNLIKTIIKKMKHYFLPQFIIDIFNLPRDIIRLIRKLFNFRNSRQSKEVRKL